MTTEAYSIEVRENGSARARDAIASIATATDKTDASVNKLNKSMDDSSSRMGSMQRTAQSIGSAFGTLGAVIGGAFSLSKVIEFSDGFTKIQNQLRRTNTDTVSLGAATDKVFAISQKTGTAFDANATTYVKVQQALQQLNQDTGRAGPLLTTIAQAVQGSGVSAQSAAAGLYQFTQGLNQGVLRGEDFNSVMEQIPGLASAIAVGLNIPIGALRSLAENGELTADKIFRALERVAPNVAASAAQAIPTVEQALVRLNNAFTRYLGQSAQGPVQLLAKGITLLADNIQYVIPVVGAMGAAVAAWIAIQAVAWVASIVQGLVLMAAQLIIATVRVAAFGLAWVAANIPLVAAAVALGALGVALLIATGQTDKAVEAVKFLKGEFEELTKSTVTTGNATKTLEELQKGLTGSMGGASKAANGATQALNDTSSASGQLVSSFDQLKARWDQQKQVAEAAAAAYAQAGQAARQAAAELASVANAFNNAAMASSYYNSAVGGATSADVASQMAGASGYSSGSGAKYDPVVSGGNAPGIPSSGSSGGSTGFGPSVSQQIRASQDNLANQMGGRTPGYQLPAVQGAPPGYIGTYLPVSSSNMQGIDYKAAYIPAEYAGMRVTKGVSPPGTLWLDKDGKITNPRAMRVPEGTEQQATSVPAANTAAATPPPLPDYVGYSKPTQRNPSNPNGEGATVVNQTITQTFNVKDYDSLRRNKTQIAQDTLRSLRV